MHIHTTQQIYIHSTTVTLIYLLLLHLVFLLGTSSSMVLAIV